MLQNEQMHGLPIKAKVRFQNFINIFSRAKNFEKRIIRERK